MSQVYRIEREVMARGQTIPTFRVIERMGSSPCPRCGDVMAVHGNHAGAEVKCSFRDESRLTDDLVGFEGWRVEVVDIGDVGESSPRRFYVGKSTGWQPIHLEIARRNALSGGPARKNYASVRRLYKR